MHNCFHVLLCDQTGDTDTGTHTLIFGLLGYLAVITSAAPVIQILVSEAENKEGCGVDSNAKHILTPTLHRKLQLNKVKKM